jgi:hypothetical protein
VIPKASIGDINARVVLSDHPGRLLALLSDGIEQLRAVAG